MSARKKNIKRKHNRAGMIIAVAVLIALEIWLDSLMRPVIESITSYQARISAARLINEAMLSQMEQDDISYDKLVQIIYADNGEITAIEADMAQINRFKSRVSDAVIEKLQNTSNQRILVPVGTLVGNQFTSGRGPLVEIKLVPAGYVQTEIYNEFVTAGINQTLHQIMLQINVRMTAVLPGYSVSSEMLTNFCIAETVIIGKVPQGYANLGSGAAVYSQINPDAAAEK